jgi:hypothetical protein
MIYLDGLGVQNAKVEVISQVPQPIMPFKTTVPITHQLEQCTVGSCVYPT